MTEGDSGLAATDSSWLASDGYAIHVKTWKPALPPLGFVVILHGVQSHGGWYEHLGRTLVKAGYEALFPDRRGSGGNRVDRGHTPSMSRLLDDVTEFLKMVRDRDPNCPITLAGISWGGKLAILTAGRYPKSVDALALICPGLHPRVGVSLVERLRIAFAYVFDRRKTFPIPLSDPALFTSSHPAQEFIANDPLGLRAATAGLLAASTFIDRVVRRMPPRVKQPALLMLAGLDRIVDNDRTRVYFDRLASEDRQILEYPEGHHTLEFDPDPSRYALDLVDWLGRVFPPRAASPEDRRTDVED